MARPSGAGERERDGVVVLEDRMSSLFVRRATDGAPPKSRRALIMGRPLATADASHQSIGKVVGLAVFASDALSSTAYATQEILVILAAAGAVAFGLALPISMAIVALLAVVTISYQQTIHAYPSGGGAYIVARDNLGELPAQMAGAALLTDYILTVAVSVSSGVNQLVSAFPNLFGIRVALAAGFVLVIMLLNLRGVKESGRIFAVPTYFFVGAMLLTVGVGLFRHATGTLGLVVNPPLLELKEVAPIGMFLILHAFASGTTALTGVEAISNGITAFREPRSRNAGITLVAMSLILGTLFLGITYLAVHIGAVPSETETVISQLGRTVFGGPNALYLTLIGATTTILIMAANTAFADFPRLAALQAGDGFLPRQLMYRGSRLVFSRGILALSLVAILLIVVFQASVAALIPLYAIGVFLSFTLSQLGMAVRWRKVGRLAPAEEVHEPGSVLVHDPRWRIKMLINGFGAVTTFVVMLVFGVTKFSDGAWLIVFLIPVLVWIFLRIHVHYKRLARRLSLEDYGEPPHMSRHRVVLPIGGVHRGTLAALDYARSLSRDITAVHVSIDPVESARLRDKWDEWGDGVRLLTIESPYRLLVEPLLAYIDELAALRQPNEVITVIVPQFVPEHWWQNFLHAQTALVLRMALIGRKGIVITDVPYHVD